MNRAKGSFCSALNSKSTHRFAAMPNALNVPLHEPPRRTIRVRPTAIHDRIIEMQTMHPASATSVPYRTAPSAKGDEPRGRRIGGFIRGRRVRRFEIGHDWAPSDGTPRRTSTLCEGVRSPVRGFLGCVQDAIAPHA